MAEQHPDLNAALSYAAAQAGPVVASLGGAIVSLSFLKVLTVRGRLSAVVAGTLIAVFLAPALIDLVPYDLPPSVQRAVQFLFGVSGLGVMPLLLIRIKKYAGDPLSLVKDFAHIKGAPQ